MRATACTRVGPKKSAARGTAERLLLVVDRDVIFSRLCLAGGPARIPRRPAGSSRPCCACAGRARSPSRCPVPWRGGPAPIPTVRGPAPEFHPAPARGPGHRSSRSRECLLESASSVALLVLVLGDGSTGSRAESSPRNRTQYCDPRRVPDTDNVVGRISAAIRQFLIR